MERWIWMWATAGTLFAGCKWLTYRAAVRPRAAAAGGVGWPRACGYLLAWPGMDAHAFFFSTRTVAAAAARPALIEWLAASVKTLFGITLTWGVARAALPAHPLVAGWIGMIGIVFLLHFGVFHLLSLAWRQAGVDAEPLMRNPLRATSLAEFWGRRWNTAFHALATRFSFRPLRRVTSAATASVLVFLLSGLVHELVITLPARGGYGLPTAYFLLQALGLAAERSTQGRRLGLGRGWRGWIFTILVTAGPAFVLFPPVFIRNVILPMLSAVGAN
jgi:hypothetical protein